MLLTSHVAPRLTLHILLRLELPELLFDAALVLVDEFVLLEVILDSLL